MYTFTKEVEAKLTKVFIEGSTPRFLQLSGFRPAPEIIEVQGKNFVAAEIVENILGRGAGMAEAHDQGGIKFGPGGRRVYVRITEKLVEQFSNPFHPRTKDQAARNEEIKDFALALIDFIS